MDYQKEKEELESIMKKFSVDIIEQSEFKDGRYLSVQADIDCDVSIPFMKGLALRKMVLRGSHYYVTFNDSVAGKLTMTISVALPKDFLEVYKTADLDMLTVIGTTFPDLCWIHAEGTTPQTMNEVDTKFREDVINGDLTWVLPSKFVDDIVEMMHTMNQSILSGLMQDSIFYGPYVFDKEEI